MNSQAPSSSRFYKTAEQSRTGDACPPSWMLLSGYNRGSGGDTDRRGAA
jgi:hypothetical protein